MRPSPPAISRTCHIPTLKLSPRNTVPLPCPGGHCSTFSFCECPSSRCVLCDWLISVRCQGSSLSPMSEFPSFPRLNNIPSYGQAAFVGHFSVSDIDSFPSGRESRCWELECANACSSPCAPLKPRTCIAGSFAHSIFTFFRKLHAIFHSNSTILHSHQ